MQTEQTDIGGGIDMTKPPNTEHDKGLKYFMTLQQNELFLKEGSHRLILKNRELGKEDERDIIYDIDTLVLKNSKGKNVGYVIFCENLTEKYKLQEKLQSMEKLSLAGQLAAGAAHEIKNPLASIRGFVQLLQESFHKNDKRREYTKIIIEEVDRLNELVRELLFIAKPSPDVKTRGNINKTVDDTILVVNSKAIMNDVVIHRESSEVPEIIFNPEHMKQVFLNLMNNAIDAMPKGGNLFVRSFHKDNRIHIEIQDEGCGIKPEHIDRLFEPFFTTKEDGTGLGLPITKKIIQNHSGEIQVKSKPGKGSCFTVLLPTM
ncbi:MAG: hypothetical protein PWQ82_1323 [Thermosediminibacterales bacterium]|nr:hypothetical protein [Thermosediminibacterales bacterium]